MRVLVMAGFLGSGKTTIVRTLIQGLIDEGKTCAIIENEIGEVGIDDALVGEAGLEVTPLFGGCVCCTISGSLIFAVERIEKEIAPDWVIVEMTGLALLKDIKRLFSNYYPNPDVSVHTLSVVDASRWHLLIGPLNLVFSGQVKGAEVSLLNKLDVNPATEEMYTSIAERSNAIVIEKTPELENGVALWAALEEAFARADELPPEEE